jgi:hypothetical protein
MLKYFTNSLIEKPFPPDKAGKLGRVEMGFYDL